MFKFWSLTLILACCWQLGSCRSISDPNYHGVQPYQGVPYTDYGYPYSGHSPYHHSPYYPAPHYHSPYHHSHYHSSPYTPPGTYYDEQKGILRPFPGNGIPLLVDYLKRCANQFIGLKPHPEQRQYYYVCKPDSVIFGKCQNLQIFNATCGQCVQHPRPDYLPVCTSLGRFPIYSDCRLYYKCEADMKPQVYTCSPNTIFSPATKKCVVGNRCTTTQITKTGTFIPESCKDKCPSCYENGVFRSPTDCSVYYTCELQSNGTFLQTGVSCCEGEFYDLEKKKCLPKDQVPCDIIQVAELVYPKPNPLPYYPSAYPSHFHTDSLEEIYYPIESEPGVNDNTGSEYPCANTTTTTTTTSTYISQTPTTTPTTTSTSQTPVPTTTSTSQTTSSTTTSQTTPSTTSTSQSTTPTSTSQTTPSTTTSTTTSKTSTTKPKHPKDKPDTDSDETGVLEDFIDFDNENFDDAVPETTTEIDDILEGSGSTESSGSESTESSTEGSGSSESTEGSGSSESTESPGGSSEEDNDDVTTVKTTTDDDVTTDSGEDNEDNELTTEETITTEIKPTDIDETTETVEDLTTPTTSTSTESSSTQSSTTTTIATTITTSTESSTTTTITTTSLPQVTTSTTSSSVSPDDNEPVPTETDDITREPRSTTLKQTTTQTLPTTKLPKKKTNKNSEKEDSDENSKESESSEETGSSEETEPTTTQKTPTTINTTTQTLSADTTQVPTTKDDIDETTPAPLATTTTVQIQETTQTPPVETTQTPPITETIPDEKTSQTPPTTIIPTTENIPIVTTDFNTDYTDGGFTIGFPGTTEFPNFDYYDEDDEVAALDSEIVIDNSRISEPETTESPNDFTVSPEGTTTNPNDYTDYTDFTDSPNTTDMFNDFTDEAASDFETIIDDSQLTTEIEYDKNPLVAEELIPVSNKPKKKTSIWNEKLDKSKTTKPSKPKLNELIEEEYIPVKSIKMKPSKPRNYKGEYTTEFPYEGTTDFPYEGTTDFPYEGITDFPYEGTTDFPYEGITDFPHEGTTDFDTEEYYPDITTRSSQNVDSSEEDAYIVDYKHILQDEYTTQAPNEQTTLPQTTDNPTQTSTSPKTTTTQISATSVETHHPPTYSTTLSTTQTPTTTPKYNETTTPIPPCSKQSQNKNTNDFLIQVRDKTVKHKPHKTSSTKQSLYYFLDKEPVTNNKNKNSSKTVQPPCDDTKSEEIPRLEIIAERPIDVHFSICPKKCDKDHEHNFSDNRAVFLRWYANKSDQTMGFETSNKIKTGGDVDC